MLMKKGRARSCDRDRPRVEEASERADASRDAALLPQAGLHLVKTDMRGGVNQLQKKGRMRIELGAFRQPLAEPL